MADCLFCKIIAGDIPAKKVHEDAHTLAFEDINPQAPTHVLVIPKQHYANAAALAAADPGLLAELFTTAHAIARKEALIGNDTDEPGYRLVTNTGRESGQSVFHLHLHLLGGRHMGWPPG